MEGESGLEYQINLDEDNLAIFDIPEETIEVYQDSSSDSGSLSHLDDFSEPDDSASDDDSDVRLPEFITQLQEKLLQDYTLPSCPTQDPPQSDLSRAERLSLYHYFAWTESHGTVKAYDAHAWVLVEATGEEILTFHKVRQLALTLSGLRPSFVDMCPKSCMAFTGDSQSDATCTHVRKCKVCNEPRYQLCPNSPRAKPKPRAKMLYMPLTPIIQACYSNQETAHQMWHRDNVLKETSHALAIAANVVEKSEFSNSDNHVCHYEKMGRFHDEGDVALSISSDGAQLTMKKQSNMWLLIVVLLNLPPEMCYRAKNVIIPLAIPGPSAAANIESFIYPLFEEMARAKVGMWTWDAVDSSYFVLKAYICGVNGDMLGSAKLSGMVGHSALHGDRFTMVQGARSAGQTSARAQYYPISPPESAEHNSTHPIFDLYHLPYRSQRHYWDTIQRLKSAPTQAELQRIVHSTGVSQLTICAASPAFLHPSFFPLDPFHLFYENCMVHIWDLWVTYSTEDEQIHMATDMASLLGEKIEKAMKTLPSSFCSPIRDPYKKQHSQYKAYEWMVLLHWYIIPIAWELGFDREVLENFRKFVDIIEVAMSHSQSQIMT